MPALIHRRRLNLRRFAAAAAGQSSFQGALPEPGLSDDGRVKSIAAVWQQTALPLNVAPRPLYLRQRALGSTSSCRCLAQRRSFIVAPAGELPIRGRCAPRPLFATTALSDQHPFAAGWRNGARSSSRRPLPADLRNLRAAASICDNGALGSTSFCRCVAQRRFRSSSRQLVNYRFAELAFRDLYCDNGARSSSRRPMNYRFAELARRGLYS